MANTTVEISVPILNEEKVLETNLLALRQYLKWNLDLDDISWTIVVADNGSSDSSPEIMRKLCDEYSDIRYIRLDQIGVGIALKTSWTNSIADIVGYMDVDLATSLRYFRQALVAIICDDFDLVYGTRLHKESKVYGRTLKRELTSRAFNWILKRYLKVNFSDGMCGFKFLKRDVATSLIRQGAQNNGWFFSTELLFVAERHGYKIFELPIEWRDSRESKVKIAPLCWKYLVAMHHIKKFVDSSS